MLFSIFSPIIYTDVENQTGEKNRNKKGEQTLYETYKQHHILSSPAVGQRICGFSGERLLQMMKKNRKYFFGCNNRDLQKERYKL